MKEFGVDEEPEDEDKAGPPIVDHVDADQRERIIFQFLRDVPHLLNADRLGMETCTVSPGRTKRGWPTPSSSGFPSGSCCATRSAWARPLKPAWSIRQLVLSGVVRRVLILVPKSVLVQWQEELYEKFVLNVPRYDGNSFHDVFGRELPGVIGDNPWDAHPIMLGIEPLGKAARTTAAASGGRRLGSRGC